MTTLLDFIEKYTNLKKQGGICSTKGKLAELQEKLKYLKTTIFVDDFFWLAKTEKHLLGIALSAN